jgi:hypothetical protein
MMRLTYSGTFCASLMPRDRADVVAALTSKEKGFDPDKRSGRDHDWYFFRHPRLIRSVGTYVSRGSDKIPDKLLGKMSRQLQMTRAQFDFVVDCTWNRSEIVAHLQSRGLLRTGQSSP